MHFFQLLIVGVGQRKFKLKPFKRSIYCQEAVTRFL